MSAKNQGKDPTPGELGFVTNVLLHGEAPLYIKWVTKRKRELVQDRLLVVGKYRIFSIKKTMTGKKSVQRVGHLFDLTQIYSPDIDRVVFKFKDFEIDATETSIPQLIQVVREAFQRVSCSFAEYACPKIILAPPERLVAELPYYEHGPGHGLVATYEAFCDYYNMRPSPEFIKFVHDSVAQGTTELIMDECPGIERKTEPMLDLTPIRAALRHNTYFTAFIMRQIPRKEAAIKLADTMMHNVTFQKLHLVGSDAQEQGVVALGAALRQNAHNCLTDLDLSCNPDIKEKGFAAVGQGLASMNHSLIRLNLACCDMSSRAAAAVIAGLGFGKEVAKELTELDFSHNGIGGTGSLQLSNWFSQQGSTTALKKLYLTNTRLDVGAVSHAMKMGQIFQLEELDISSNRMDLIAAQSLASLVESSHNLKKLSYASSGVPAQGALLILQAVHNNQMIHDVYVDLSNNELGVQGATAVGQLLGNNSNIHSLVMKSCSFKKEGLTRLTEQLANNRTLKLLDLSLNFASGSSTKMFKLMTSLATVVKGHPSLEHLAIAGDTNKYAIGKEIQPIISALNENPKLMELDITGNKIGDQLAVALCDSLRNNTNLKALMWDKNHITISGWQALANILNINKTLTHCPTPRNDVDKVNREAKNRDQTQERVRDLMDKIKSALKANNGNSNETYSSVHAVNKQERSYITRTATVSNIAPPNFGNSNTLRPSFYASDAASYSAMSSPPPYANSPSTPNPLSPPSYDSYNSPSLQRAPSNGGGYSYSNDYAQQRPISVMSPPYNPQEDPAYTEAATNYTFEEDKAYSYDYNYQQEFDDSQYEDGAPPPPPPF